MKLESGRGEGMEGVKLRFGGGMILLRTCWRDQDLLKHGSY